MPIHTQYNHEDEIFHTTFSENIDTKQINNHIADIIEQSQNKLVRGDLVDLSTMQNIDISTYDILLTSEKSKPVLHSSPQFKLAIIAPTNFAFGMARQFQTFYDVHNTVEVNIFKTVKEGIQWLKD